MRTSHKPQGAAAGAQADTILEQNSTYLLGLVLGIRTAELRNDAAARAQLVRRLRATVKGERAKKLKEYTDHAADIDAALGQAALPKP